ncbi:MAG: S9 family peptidase [Altererythrobacter sp. XM-24bin4]|jgi:dipeptidyl aminopeptidase/acylaminoacyl peptidase|nr:MAG: S9 family peptidase [Altererythrobacter sp. XM-24bin4]
MRIKSPLVAGMVGAAALLLSPTSDTVQAQSNAQVASDTIPVEIWSLRSVVNAVQISPDGKHILVHKTESREGDYLLEIYKTDDLLSGDPQPYRRLNASPMEIISASWVTDNHIFGTAWQVNRDRVTRPEADIRDYKSFSYNLEENKFNNIDGNFGIVELLPNEPDTILISQGRAVSDGLGVDPFSAFRPQAYYRFNLNTGGRSLQIKGNEKTPSITFDNAGNPRFSQSVDPGTNELVSYYRLPGESSWKELDQRYDYDDHENLYRVLSGFMGLAGFDPNNPNIGYMIDNRGEDKAALWEFDFTTGQFGKKLFQSETSDVMGIRLHSVPGNDHLAGAMYPDWRMETHWFDEEEKALYEALEQQIPYAHQISVSSRSRDGKRMIVTNRGPRDPGSYYLITEAGIAKLGSRNPLINPDQLNDVEFIWYTARDGLKIPAYVTVPKGEGPHPLVVQHNGGPHVNGMVSFDEWGQMLANAGYMVLYPNNRISTGWGQRHFDAGYGQHGLAMQDDKDDGVKALIEAGWVDPDRVAFFGWSYGGQAALYAATNKAGLYQCAIAGAAVADAEKQYYGRRNTQFKALDDWSKARGGLVGINPIDEVDNVSIPLLMVHPKQDRRVMYYHFEDYKKAIEKAGKDAQFMTIDGADHFSNTHMYSHQEQFNTKLLDFLRNDCGPDGL